MAKYLVIKSYRSPKHGMFVEGTTVELDPGDAKFIKMNGGDGVLREVRKPEHDRMMRKKQTR